MSVNFDFEPDGARAALLDRAMRHELALSLDYLRGVAKDHVPFDGAALGQTIAHLDGPHPFSPSIFATYYKLVPALQQGDLAAAQALFACLATAQPLKEPMAVLGLDDPALAAHRGDYQDLMRSAADANFKVVPPPAHMTARFQTMFAQGLDLIGHVAPALRAEVEAIVHEAIGVVGDETVGYGFDGGSCYALWGALFLHAGRHDTPLAMAEAITHESAHSLLFGFCTREGLVLNADEERYPSPLRTEPRPMDGIYHASFVCARMNWFCERLAALDSDRLNALGIERDAIEARLALHRRNFEDGARVVREFARLTETGRRLMEGAAARMEFAL